MTEPVPIELVAAIVAVTRTPIAGDTSIVDTSAMAEPVTIDLVVATVDVTTL